MASTGSWTAACMAKVRSPPGKDEEFKEEEEEEDEDETDSSPSNSTNNDFSVPIPPLRFHFAPNDDTLPTKGLFNAPGRGGVISSAVSVNRSAM
mmetsp:Transcript_22630/g.46397  ORF Transcript_22630/g.46397 Transcript_22630/m.46397 type:complete len:94 (-) Transcript_22630:360-641(-)